jgi:hypothetical protein
MGHDDEAALCDSRESIVGSSGYSATSQNENAWKRSR